MRITFLLFVLIACIGCHTLLAAEKSAPSTFTTMQKLEYYHRQKVELLNSSAHEHGAHPHALETATFRPARRIPKPPPYPPPEDDLEEDVHERDVGSAIATTGNKSSASGPGVSHSIISNRAATPITMASTGFAPTPAYHIPANTPIGHLLSGPPKPLSRSPSDTDAR